MLNILITLLIVAVLVYLCFWVVDSVGLPNPMNWIAKAIIAIIALAALLPKLSGLGGGLGL